LVHNAHDMFVSIQDNSIKQARICFSTVQYFRSHFFHVFVRSFSQIPLNVALYVSHSVDPSSSVNILAGVDDILNRCIDFCINSFILHASKNVVLGGELWGFLYRLL